MSRATDIFAAICPHPPIIVPAIGRPADLKLVSKTINGMKQLAEKFAQVKPKTVIVISPHGPVTYNEMSIVSSPALFGNFQMFGDFQTKLNFENDLDLAGLIFEEAQKENIPVRQVNSPQLDHGTLVPLYYLIQNVPRTLLGTLKIVPIAYSYLDLETHFKFGKILKKVINRSPASVNYGIVASGDLSHRLTLNAPAGYSSRGKEFDEKLIKLLKNKDIKGILNMDPDLVEEAGECGYRSIIILLGILNGLNWQPEILSYEGPFGVGYLVANFKLN